MNDVDIMCGLKLLNNCCKNSTHIGFVSINNDSPILVMFLLRALKYALIGRRKTCIRIVIYITCQA